MYCEHIQKFINNIDIVDSCAVVPKPNDDLLYESKAYIVLRDGVAANNDIMEYIKMLCSSEISDKQTGEKLQLKTFEIPQSFSFIESLPKNQADKIDFHKLEVMANQEYENEKIKREKVK